ncbi:hypothetical protein ACQ4PT_008242 [Festuca glaucescens]
MSRGDRFGALQDDLVQHVLSFLPSRDSVRSAVISRRWHHLWKSTPVVHVTGNDDRFRLFVNSLLLHRDTTPPLRSFENEEVDSDDEDYGDDPPYVVDPHVDQWISHAVSTCHTRSLTARFPEEDTMWSPRQPRPFASPHLTTMHLDGVKLKDGLLDFSCCPALLHLSLTSCRLYAGAFVSPSLECLSIIACDIRIADGRTRMGVSTPSLRHLQLCGDVAQGFPKAPCLESMPWSTKSSIRLTGYLAQNPAPIYNGGDHSRAGPLFASAWLVGGHQPGAHGFAIF